eukprot:scaffold109506_cov17-Prasinocladus_malaysianus.AAC.1
MTRAPRDLPPVETRPRMRTGIQPSSNPCPHNYGNTSSTRASTPKDYSYSCPGGAAWGLKGSSSASKAQPKVRVDIPEGKAKGGDCDRAPDCGPEAPVASKDASSNCFGTGTHTRMDTNSAAPVHPSCQTYVPVTAAMSAPAASRNLAGTITAGTRPDQWIIA